MSLPIGNTSWVHCASPLRCCMSRYSVVRNTLKENSDMTCHFLLIQTQIKPGKPLKGGRELAQMTKAQSCVQLEKSPQQLASYQRKEERLRRWTEG